MAYAQEVQTFRNLLADTPEQAAMLDWPLCNETSFVLRVATVTLVGENLTPQGWMSLPPGECKIVTHPEKSPRYAFAESEIFHLGGIREWKGDIPFCITDSHFRADAAINCALQNFNTQLYFQVDPKELKTTFIEPDHYGQHTLIAGIQRLLKDIGYENIRIDGHMGRKTQRQIQKFLKQQGKPGGLPHTEIIASLIEVAKQQQDFVGLNICNHSSQKIWTAIAYKHKQQWLSKGWWPLSPQSCQRPFTDRLKNTNLYLYATQEQKEGADKVLRGNLEPSENFCITQAAFYAQGRSYCTDRGYTNGRFRAIVAKTDGVNIYLNDEDFINPENILDSSVAPLSKTP